MSGYTNGLLILLLNANNIILIGDNYAILHSFIDILSTKLRMKDLDPLHYVFGIQAHHGGLYLIQLKYAEDLLCRLGMESSKRRVAPSFFLSHMMLLL